jgi:adenylyltransferase/sulfurtransferase
VLCIGAGGIGSSCLLYLAGAGIGKIGVIDSDVVERTNLHRQVIHSAHSVGQKKVDSAKAKMNALNDFSNVETHFKRIIPANAQELIRDYDIVIDGSDNAKTRYLINDACVLENVSF